jgi:hypothetical protein
VNYTHGQSVIRPRTEEVRAELSRLNRLKSAILVETAAKQKELARIRNARRRLEPVATYEPTPEALAYREQYGHIVAQQPRPVHGGRNGLRMAADEAALVEARKREAA